MGKGFTFNFFDKNRDTNIRYLAKYDTDLSIDITCEAYERSKSQLPHVEKRGKAVDPWAIFREHATFNSILRGLDLYAVRTRQDTKNKPDNYYRTWKPTVYEFPGNEDRNVPKHDIQTITTDYAAILRNIADNPDVLLYHQDTLDGFVMLLWAAKTGVMPPYMKETREEIKQMLSKYLVPKHPSGKTIFPQGYESARVLLKSLAKHLSKKCLTILKKETIESDKGDTFDTDQAYRNLGYDTLMSWGKSSEPRIIQLNRRCLYDLIHSPAYYADQLLQKELSVGLRTLNNPSAK